MKKRISIVLLTIALTLGQVAPVYATGSNSVLTTDVAEIIAEEQVEEATTEAVTQSMEEESVSVSTTETVIPESEMSVKNNETDIVESSEATVEKTEDNSADMTEMADVENAENVISEASYATMNLSLDDENGEELLPLTNLEWSKEKSLTLQYYNPNDVDVFVMIEFGDSINSNLLGARETGMNDFSYGHDLYKSGDYTAKIYVFPVTMGWQDAYDKVSSGNCDESIVSTSPVYTYVRPEELPIPENVVFNQEGIVTWDSIESEYVSSYCIWLYEVNAYGDKRYIDQRNIYSTEELKADFSSYIETGKKYAIRFYVNSNNIVEAYHSQNQDLIYMIGNSDSGDSDSDAGNAGLLPLTNLEWRNERGFAAQCYNPNDENVMVILEYLDTRTTWYIGACETSMLALYGIKESGDYTYTTYVFPNTVGYSEALEIIDSGNYDESTVSTSPTYTYVRPEEQLPIPENVVFNKDGIVTWDAIENEYVDYYYVNLYDVSNGYHIMGNSVSPLGELKYDFSSEIESGKEYGIKISAYSWNIEKIYHSETSDYIYMTGDSDSDSSDDGNSGSDNAGLLPLTNLEWDNEGTLKIKFYNPNDVSVRVVFSTIYEAGICDMLPYETHTKDLSSLGSSGEYTFKTYVFPITTSYEDVWNGFATVDESFISISPEYSYVRPEEQLPIPSNVVFSEDGIVTWNEIENEYVKFYHVFLYDITNGNEIYVDQRCLGSDDELKEDFSNYIESGKKYVIKMSVDSSNIEKICGSGWSEYIYMTNDSDSDNSGTDGGETPNVTPSDKPTETPDVTPNDKPTETPIVTQKPSTDENKSNDTGVNHTEKTTYQKTEEVTIVEEIVPLAADVEKVGFEYVDIKMNQKTAKLKKELLAKYYGRQTQLMVHLGNKIGYSIDTAILSKEQNDVSLAASVNTLDNFAEGFTTMHIKPSTATMLNQAIGIHLNAGVEHAGKMAFIYARNLETNTMEFVQAVIVNEIGNVSLMSNEITDVVVMIQE